MRRRCPGISALALALWLAIMAAPVAAQSASDDGRADLYGALYPTILRCIVVNSYTDILLRKANQPDRAAHYKELSKKTYRMAYMAGNMLGYSEQRVSRDIDDAISREMPRLQDAAYYREALAQCRAYQLSD